MKNDEEIPDHSFPSDFLVDSHLTMKALEKIINIFDASSVNFKVKFAEISRIFSKLLSYPERITLEEISNELEVSSGFVKERLKIMKEIAGKTTHNFLKKKLEEALSNIKKEDSNSANLKVILFCPNCKSLLSIPDKNGFKKCPRCQRKVKSEGRKVLVIKAKPLKERKIQEDEQ